MTRDAVFANCVGTMRRNVVIKRSLNCRPGETRAINSKTRGTLQGCSKQTYHSPKEAAGTRKLLTRTVADG